MLRHLYKTFIISIMCGSLSIMNMMAFAQDNGASTSPNMAVSAPKNAAVRDANGVYKKTETQSFSGTKGGEDNAINVITMLAVGFVGTRLLMYKKWTTDMSIVAAASAAYIAAEIFNIMNLKKQLSDMNVQLTKSSDGKKDQAQIETIEKLKESYEKAKSGVKTRKMLQMGAAALFAAATGVAAFQRFTEDGQYASCEAGIVSAEAQLSTCAVEKAAEAKTICTATMGAGCAAAVALEKEAADCTACASTIAHLGTALKSVKAKDEIPAPSLPKAAEGTPLDTANKAQATAPCTGIVAEGIKKSMVTSACTTYLTNKELNKGFGANFVAHNPSVDKIFYVKAAPANLTIDPDYAQKNFLFKVLDFFVAKADAGLVSLLGLGSGAAAAFFAARIGIAQEVDTYMYTPGGRIIAWGIMTGAAYLGAQASQNEIDKIDENIKKIDKILEELKKLQDGIKANKITEQQIKLANFNANSSASVPLTLNPNIKTDCLSSGPNGACSSLENQIKEMPGYANLPDSFKSIASQSAKIGEGLSGTSNVSGSTLSSLNKLGGSQNAISKLTERVKAQLNAKLASSGKAPIDFDKEENKLLNSLKGETRKAFASKGYSPSEFVASVGLSKVDASLVKTNANPSGTKKNSAASSGAFGAPAIKGANDKSFELDFKEAPLEDAQTAVADGASAKEEKYDIGENDINTNTGESIFQMISNRYIKSGYPKLLEEEPVKK